MDSSDTHSPSTPRAFLGVMFECCKVYVRIYKNKEGSAYSGNCPKCSKPVRIAIGKDGTGHRFFTAQ